MKQKITKKYLKYLLLVIFLFVVAFFAVAIFLNKETSKLENPPKKIEIEEKPEIITSPYNNELPNYRLSYNNNNIYGKLEIPGIGLDTLVTRASDNNYYLENNLYNVHDGLGAPFFDYRNTDLNNERQINIYGHNTQNEKFKESLPFIKLESYLNKTVFDQEKQITLKIDERQINYELIAIKILKDGNPEHMQVKFVDELDFKNHINRLLEGSTYISDDLKIEPGDKIIVLQVCHYDPPGSYLLAIGKEIIKK